MAEKRAEILVIGGGPAGLAAAKAASSHGKKVTVIDENPDLGGQIWRAEKRKLSPHTRNLIDALENNGVEMIPACTCVAALPDKRILALSHGKTFPIAYDKAIIATGARERFIPFPGWTLPGVYGAGGLQALVKGGFDISGKRIVVAGTGPLLLAVAAYLKKKGGIVLFIAEQAPFRRLIRLGLSSLGVRGKFSEGIRIWRALRPVQYRTASLVTEARGGRSLESIAVKRFNKRYVVECDLLAVGHHLVPNAEVAEIFGCAIRWPSVLVDDLQRTSIEDIYCAGEPTGVGGLEKSLIEGRIAGLAAAGKAREARSFSSRRRRYARFASRLSAVFPNYHPDLAKLPADDTIVCRCEDVIYDKVKDFEIFNEAKLQTRIGMGSCQGRVCGTACEALFDWDRNSVRPPLVPLRISELANFETEND